MQIKFVCLGKDREEQHEGPKLVREWHTVRLMREGGGENSIVVLPSLEPDVAAMFERGKLYAATFAPAEVST